MTHPVYAAIARERARYDTTELAVRIVTDLHTVAAAHDSRAAEVVARLEHLADRGRPADAFRAGLIVSEYLGITDDYEASRWARQFGRALLAARRTLDEHAPERDPDGNGLRWSDQTIRDTAAAVEEFTRPSGGNAGKPVRLYRLVEPASAR